MPDGKRKQRACIEHRFGCWYFHADWRAMRLRDCSRCGVTEFQKYGDAEERRAADLAELAEIEAARAFDNSLAASSYFE